MRHLFSTRLRVILIVALVLSIGLTIVSGAVNQSIPSLLVQGILAPLKAGANALTNQAEKYYGYMFRYESMAAENEALKAQIADMEDEARQADSYQRENQRLRKLLDLTSVREDFVLVDAYIIAWSSTDWSSTVTINKGTDAGIGLDMCAITANGEVVGLVTEVGENLPWSRRFWTPLWKFPQPSPLPATAAWSRVAIRTAGRICSGWTTCPPAPSSATMTRW